jgi:hypothetical protein
MAENIQILGQLAPSATTLSTLYTVPAATQTVVSSIVVCNAGGASDTFRISIAQGGAADNIKQYIYRDVSIAANDTFIATIGLTLDETDVIKVYSTNGTNTSFSIFGVENDSASSSASITVATGSSTFTNISTITFSGSVVVTNPATGVVSVTPTGTGGSGISSINGESGPAITIAAGSGISIASGSNVITITNTGGGGGGGSATGSLGGYAQIVTITTATTQSLTSGVRYIANASSPGVYFTLPTSPALSTTGSVFQIAGRGAGGYKIVQSASQAIYFGNTQTTTGTSGSIETTHARDCIEIEYVSTGEWQVISSVGEFIVN